MSTPFIRLDSEFLKETWSGNPGTPSLYFSSNPLVREVFWLRPRFVFRMLNRYAPRKDTCLDFCGGSGIMLPSLCTAFRRVILVDLNVADARKVAHHQKLENVELVQRDVLADSNDETQYDAIVAADVLEHFLDLDEVIGRIRSLLVEDGVLVTSLPTENWFYDVLRKIFRQTKPPDHYHGAQDIEARLKAAGFRKVAGYYVPLFFPVLPLYSIAAWTKDLDNLDSCDRESR